MSPSACRVHPHPSGSSGDPETHVFEGQPLRPVAPQVLHAHPLSARGAVAQPRGDVFEANEDGGMVDGFMNHKSILTKKKKKMDIKKKKKTFESPYISMSKMTKLWDFFVAGYTLC